MTDKELRRLKRDELLEMLIMLKKENDELREQLEKTEVQLRDRRIQIQNIGSIAEAALELNGVFEAAQQAAEQYLENVRLLAEEQPEHATSAETEGQSPDTEGEQPETESEESLTETKTETE